MLGEVMDIAVVRREAVFTDPRLPLAVKRVHEHAAIRVHRHEFTELVVVLRGTGVHESPGGAYPMQAGDAFVIHSGQTHGYQATAGLDLVNVLFDLADLAVPLADIGHLPGFHMLFTLEPLYRERDRFASRLRLDPESLARVTALLGRMELELTQQRAGASFAALAHFMLLVADLSRAFGEAPDAAAQRLHQLGRAISHLEHHFAEACSLDDLAQVACMSRRNLSRQFRAALGCTPVEYLHRLRIRRAVELLEDPARTVGEVAWEVGFRDPNYFARQFRAVLGQSPSAYLQRRAGLSAER
ncbi:MAG: helix-turn-helix domain-containing protein [Fimbriimonadaceae bacterium]|nr:helix-turn-helix domain-containing protein [Fimbriimonadaceae bacterium]